ncbi:MAG: hypothetical protein CL927_16680 [Deltaproteobacteria bacterium]|nr:hypothetical protein [Deltaproteobacteria bacterium]
MLTATGGLEGGLTAAALAECLFATEGRVRMTLRRLLDRGEVRITGGTGASTRYLTIGVHESSSSSSSGQDFGWGRTASAGASGDSSALLAQLAHLRDALAQREAELVRLRSDNNELRAALRRRPVVEPSSEDGLHAHIDDLLQLCHPDRHDNSARANETTRWLLALRRRRREG